MSGVLPPVSIPNWCLNEQALKKFNCSTNEIPIYDHNTDQDNEYDEYNTKIKIKIKLPIRGFI